MGFNLGSFIMLMLRSDPGEAHVDSITLFVLLLCACVIIGHLLEKNRYMNESITALGIGLFTGIIILFSTEGKSSHILVFNEELFFIYLLPPIIFNAGFQVKKKQFFRNFSTIVLFGAIGSLISFFIISLGSMHLFKKLDIGFLDVGDYYALGAILTATDSVCTLQVLNQDDTPLLYSLVFGEGVVNDATSVVLFHAIRKFDLSHITSSNAIHLVGSFFYLFLTSTLLGISVGLLTAYIIRKLYLGRHSTDREIALMILMAYLSYMMAELCLLSGILTVFFCGIVMSHYTWHNVTKSSKITTKHAFATLSFISEIFIFLYVGMDVLDIDKWNFVRKSPGTSLEVSLILLGLVLVGRAAFVFPLSFLANLTRKHKGDQIGFKQQVTIWWAGLMRGAVSIALAYNQFTRLGHTQLRGNAIMITSTITVVLFTNVVFGLLTKPLIRYLLPSHNQTEHGTVLSELPSLANPLLSYGEGDQQVDVGDNDVSPGPQPRSLSNSIHYYWRMLDDAYMRPVFGGRGFVPNTPASSFDKVIH